MQSCSLWCISPTWVSQVLVWHHCHHVFARSWMRQFRPSPFSPRVHNLSIETTNACCRFRQARAGFTTADGKLAESVRCCPLEPSRCFAMMSMVSRKVCSPFSCCLAHAFVLLDVSRLLGLTLRHFASVCCCHRDSLTRWRLALAQEAVRVFLFSVFSIGSARDDICRWFLAAYEKCLFKRC